ncbi:MAG TPA: hypothetical protein VH414_15035 [Lichenihabitans sp.]|nr:hypothetical protein [Lichenihabitans sp.]
MTKMQGSLEVTVGGFAVLNTGGPTMRVDRVYGDQALCTWRDKSRERSDTFPIADLTSVHADAFRPTGEPRFISEEEDAAGTYPQPSN